MTGYNKNGTRPETCCGPIIIGRRGSVAYLFGSDVRHEQRVLVHPVRFNGSPYGGGGDRERDDGNGRGGTTGRPPTARRHRARNTSTSSNERTHASRVHAQLDTSTKTGCPRITVARPVTATKHDDACYYHHHHHRPSDEERALKLTYVRCPGYGTALQPPTTTSHTHVRDTIKPRRPVFGRRLAYDDIFIFPFSSLQNISSSFPPETPAAIYIRIRDRRPPVGWRIVGKDGSNTRVLRQRRRRQRYAGGDTTRLLSIFLRSRIQQLCVGDIAACTPPPYPGGFRSPRERSGGSKTLPKKYATRADHDDLSGLEVSALGTAL